MPPSAAAPVSRPDAPAERMRNEAAMAEGTARTLVEDLREDLSRWHRELAWQRVAAERGAASEPVDRLILNLRNARQRLVTELQAQPRAVRTSGVARTCRRSLDRALDMARALARESRPPRPPER
jgi:hypothetical protein